MPGRGRGCPAQHSPLSLGSGTAGLGHGHTAQRLLQEVLTEQLGHLSQRVHWGTEMGSAGTPHPRTAGEGFGGLRVTWVAGRAVDGLPGDTFDCPVPIHEETVAQGVAEPLHGRGHSPAVGQGHSPGTAEEGALRGEQGVRGELGPQSLGTQGTPRCPTLTARKWKQRCRLALIRRAAAT